MLLKPTLALPHGGGLKLEVKSREFEVIGNWIAEGAPGVVKNDAKLVRIEAFPPRVQPRNRKSNGKSLCGPGIPMGIVRM